MTEIAGLKNVGLTAPAGAGGGADGPGGGVACVSGCGVGVGVGVSCAVAAPAAVSQMAQRGMANRLFRWPPCSFRGRNEDASARAPGNGYESAGGERPERSRPARRDRRNGAAQRIGGAHGMDARTTSASGQRSIEPPETQAMHPCAAAGTGSMAAISGPAKRPDAPGGSGWRPNEAAIERHRAAPSATRARRECFVRRSITFAKSERRILFPLGPGRAVQLNRMPP